MFKMDMIAMMMNLMNLRVARKMKIRKGLLAKKKKNHTQVLVKFNGIVFFVLSAI